MTATLHPTDPELREIALRHLAIDFPRVEAETREDVASLAYEQLLERHRSGGEIRNARQLIKVIASQRMRDVLRRAERRHRNFAVDPGDPAAELADPSAARSEDSAQRALTEVRVQAVLSQMTDQDKAVYALNFEERLTNRAAAERLGIGERTFKRRLRGCLDRMQAALEPGAFAGVRRRVVVTYLAGAGTRGPEWERARDLIEFDPESRELALRMLREHRRVAGSIDVDVAVAGAAGGGVLAGLTALIAAARDKLPLGDGGASAGSTGAAAAGGGGGGGLVAALGGSKLLATCAAGVVCIGGGGAIIASRQDDDPGEPRKRVVERDASPAIQTAPPQPATGSDRINVIASEGNAAPHEERSAKARDDGGRPGHPAPDQTSESVPATTNEVAASEFDPLATPPDSAAPEEEPTVSSSPSDDTSPSSDDGASAPSDEEFGP